MNTEEIQKIEKYFTKYSDNDYVDCMTKGEPVIGHYSHNEEDFYIVIFKDQRVYQLNSDHDTQGIELVDYDKLVERFESFTGERID